jgi:hypothetical protein
MHHRRRVNLSYDADISSTTPNEAAGVGISKTGMDGEEDQCDDVNVVPGHFTRFFCQMW